ncbi:hypothetical protein DAPPUDRAFT_314296 [Daphnia pulex]|uniref:Phospholipid-transporting ATPase n=2 Tax=Daphnia pulex TaxID=6669 RepID=E9G6N2_DAPPU|nr:hypothetical protein DAPPUDRAFT_314296 [Daphnia pulex]|eukprot:EFX85164.1 hypothetical protein DAPPUDRAFT_314296 [Daphnia pulex]
MEDIPLRVSMEDRTFDHDESDYLLSASEEANVGFRRGRRRKSYFGMESFCNKLQRCCYRKKELNSRTVWIGSHSQQTKETMEYYPSNGIRNQKYNFFTFLPMVLFQQFKFFLNLYFLIMAISQFIPEIRIGYLYTYWGPLCFVLFVTTVREAIDDFRRAQRDKEINCRLYKKLVPSGFELIPSSKIKVGDLIFVDKDERVPADMVLIRTTEKSGSCFIRTDQLDGETDWKLRLAVTDTQKLTFDTDLFQLNASVFAEKPQRDIHTFIGTFKRNDDPPIEDSLNIENTLWANTVVASGTALGLVVYTGKETRSSMNNSQPRSKVGLLDLEVNQLTKILFLAVVGLALLMMCLKGFQGPWYRYLFRFVLLFSYIIPISLRVNLDMGKAFYSWSIMKDKEIPGTVVRSTTIPEELGRISYLLSDKTGTLTENEMVFRKLHLGTAAYGTETFDEIRTLLGQAFSSYSSATPGQPSSGKMRRTVVTRIVEAAKAIGLCHNVTPIVDTNQFLQVDSKINYQASSPDEIALVSWTESVGLTLMERNTTSMTLRSPHNALMRFTVLQIFPFTSETKRMGIIVRDDQSGEIVFYMKGADTVMNRIVLYNDWLEEECGNMAREGLRTLVVAKRPLTDEQYSEFDTRYQAAKMALTDRAARVAAVVESLERDMELLAVTGVEDRLQENVKPSLELLRNAGIRIWMLTGDKLETAICIAQSSRLVPRSQSIHVFGNVTSRTDTHQELNAFRRKTDSALIIRGESLELCLKFYEHEFMELACAAPAVVCCRCTPTQKASVVRLIQEHTGKRAAAIGDGGNDVSMIQAADTGIGIVGKEGKQASLAADFSIPQFSHIVRLLLVHGRRSYKRSAALAQFVIHRGLIISTMQAVFSSVFYFASVSLYQGFLMVGYATVYTMLPVFSLVLDKDVSSKIAMTYPELYKELAKGRSLTYKTFFLWVLISIYQGGVIMYGALLLFDDEFIHIVAISFSALILTELLMVTLTARKWHVIMILGELVSLGLYVASLALFHEFFDSQFIRTADFVWKVCVITVISCLPLYILKCLHKKFSPPSYSKLT